MSQVYHPYLPAVLFGVAAVVAGLLAAALPDTTGRRLPYTLEEAEQLTMPACCARSASAAELGLQVKLTKEGEWSEVDLN